MINEGRSPNSTHDSRTHRFGYLRESNWTIQFPLGMCAQQNHWLIFRPTVEVFDATVHHNWMSLGAFQKHLVIQSLRSLLAPCRTPTAHSATSRADLGTKRRNNLKRSCQSTLRMEYPSASHRSGGACPSEVFFFLKKVCVVNSIAFVLRNKEALFNSFWQAVYQETKRGNPNVTMDDYIGAVWGWFATATLHSSIALQRNISTREAMEFNITNVEYILDTLVGSLATVAAEGKPLTPRSKFRATPRKVDNSESNRLHLVGHATGKRYSLGLGAVLRAMREATRKFSTRYANNLPHGGTTTSKGNNSMFFRLRVPR